MSEQAVIPIREIKVRATPKGRTVEPAALEEVRALLGTVSRRRDGLIEHLHRIQDHYVISLIGTSLPWPPRCISR